MNRHRPDLLSLIAGLATVAVAIVLLVPGLQAASIGRLVPAGLIAVGIALLLSGRAGSDRAEPEPATATTAGAPAEDPVPVSAGEADHTGGAAGRRVGAPDADETDRLDPADPDEAVSSHATEPEPTGRRDGSAEGDTHRLSGGGSAQEDTRRLDDDRF